MILNVDILTSYTHLDIENTNRFAKTNKQTI